MLFTVTEEMQTWAGKPKQHHTRGGEGVSLFFLEMVVAWREIENCIKMPQHFCPGL